MHRRAEPRVSPSAAATSERSHQTEDGEALRHDDQFAYVAAWEFTRRPGLPESEGMARWSHKEDLVYRPSR